MAANEPLDRRAVNRALAKTIAYRHVSDDSKADLWAAELVRLLGCMGILREGVAEALDVEGGLTAIGGKGDNRR